MSLHDCSGEDFYNRTDLQKRSPGDVSNSMCASVHDKTQQQKHRLIPHRLIRCVLPGSCSVLWEAAGVCLGHLIHQPLTRLF